MMRVSRGRLAFSHGSGGASKKEKSLGEIGGILLGVKKSAKSSVDAPRELPKNERIAIKAV